MKWFLTVVGNSLKWMFVFENTQALFILFLIFGAALKIKLPYGANTLVYLFFNMFCLKVNK